MNLEKAIESNKTVLTAFDASLAETEKAGLKLGIEALKAIEDARANNYWTPIPTLPGETKD